MALSSFVAAFNSFIRPIIKRDEDGQGLAEYALILALIALIAVLALTYLGSQISDQLNTIGNTLESQSP